MPTISVLIPVYNRERYIRECIDSVLAQSFQDWEIICCDNASTDGTWSILEGYAARDPRIRILRNETNLGPIPNWKRCLAGATGRYIHWLWSDDFIHDADFYGRMLALMQKRDCKVATCAARVLLQDTGHTFVLNSLRVPVLAFNEMVGERHSTAVSPAAWLLPADDVRRHFHDDIPVYKGLDCNAKAIGADMLMILGCMLDMGTAAVCGDPLVTFRAHSESITLTHRTGAYYQNARYWFLRKHGVRLSYAARLKLSRSLRRCGHWARSLRVLLVG